MPATSQLLYFYLVLSADDGVVECYNVMRMTGAKEDDLKILQAKGFITVLDNGFAAINDWNEHNNQNQP